jgi:hypothetical protein
MEKPPFILEINNEQSIEVATGVFVIRMAKSIDRTWIGLDLARRFQKSQRKW